MTRVKAAARQAFAAFVSPMFQFRMNLVLTVVWALMIIPGLISWRESVPFLVFVSIYANLCGHLSAVAGAVAARKVDPGDPL
jgi:hypothetical protein